MATTSDPIESVRSHRLEPAFRALASAWRSTRGPRSTVRSMSRDENYRAIIALGPDVVPLLLAELERQPDHWFAALRELTGANPVPDEDRGDLVKMAQAWLAWGAQHGRR